MNSHSARAAGIGTRACVLIDFCLKFKSWKQMSISVTFWFVSIQELNILCVGAGFQEGFKTSVLLHASFLGWSRSMLSFCDLECEGQPWGS